MSMVNITVIYYLGVCYPGVCSGYLAMDGASFYIGQPIKKRNGKIVAFRRAFVIKFAYLINGIKSKDQIFVPMPEGHR